jgi:hypothetical protein
METLFISALDIHRSKDPFRAETLLWRDKTAKTLYRRVVGGLAWPRGFRPGALVVLAERAAIAPGQQMRDVVVAAEFTDADPGQLLRRASLWGDILNCRAWMTPLRAPEVRLALDYNDERRRLRLPQLDMATPPAMVGSRDFVAYDRLVERRTMSAKTLTYGDGSQVAREYKARDRADLSRPVETFPLLAAFLWALASIDLGPLPMAGGKPLGRRTHAADSVAGY